MEKRLTRLTVNFIPLNVVVLCNFHFSRPLLPLHPNVVFSAEPQLHFNLASHLYRPSQIVLCHRSGPCESSSKQFDSFSPCSPIRQSLSEDLRQSTMGVDIMKQTHAQIGHSLNRRSSIRIGTGLPGSSRSRSCFTTSAMTPLTCRSARLQVSPPLPSFCLRSGFSNLMFEGNFLLFCLHLSLTSWRGHEFSCHENPASKLGCICRVVEVLVLITSCFKLT